MVQFSARRHAEGVSSVNGIYVVFVLSSSRGAFGMTTGGHFYCTMFGEIKYAVVYKRNKMCGYGNSHIFIP